MLIRENVINSFHILIGSAERNKYSIFKRMIWVQGAIEDHIVIETK